MWLFFYIFWIQQCSIVHAVETRGRVGTASLIVSLYTRRRWMLTFTPKPFVLAQTAPSARADFDSCTNRESNIDFSDVTIVTELHRAASMLSVATCVSVVVTAACPHSSCHTDRQNARYIFWCLLHVSDPRFRLQEDGSTYRYGMVQCVCVHMRQYEHLDCSLWCLWNTTHRTIPYIQYTVYTAVFLKVKRRVGNRQKTSEKFKKKRSLFCRLVLYDYVTMRGANDMKQKLGWRNST
jgi:hypothetical protein